MSENISVIKKVVWVALKNCTKESLALFENEKGIESPIFVALIGSEMTKWTLRLHPNGDKPENASYLSLFLAQQGSILMPFSVKYSFKIVGKTQNHKFGPRYITSEKFKEGGWGTVKLISHNKLIEKSDEFIFDGNLKIECKIEITPERTESPIQLESTLLLVSKDVQKMFEEELFVDFELRCKDGNILKCHKFILAARSPVFYAMLSNDMKEAKEGVVYVSDFESVVMKEVLRFVYCARVENLDLMSSKLIFAAEKYELNDLKKMCIESITKNLSKENVIEALIIADTISGCENLILECNKIVASNFFEISTSPDWKKKLPQDIIIKTLNHLVFLKETEYL